MVAELYLGYGHVSTTAPQGQWWWLDPSLGLVGAILQEMRFRV
jgi:hypothetical protein